VQSIDLGVVERRVDLVFVQAISTPNVWIRRRLLRFAGSRITDVIGWSLLARVSGRPAALS